MKKPYRDQWLSLVKETEYALDHSGSMIFLGVLLVGSHLLHSPAYARIVFALVLLLCLVPKIVCGFYRMKTARHAKHSLGAGRANRGHRVWRRLDFERLAPALKTGFHRLRVIAVIGAAMLFGLFFSALAFSTVNTLLDRDPEPETTTTPRLVGDYFITNDGARLPIRSQLPDDRPAKAVIVALHGFNDYSAFFEGPGNYFKHYGIASYAYDQRGFGGAPKRGFWAGIPAYTRDLSEFIQLIRDRHPDRPLYVLGESMGAAELMVALTDERPPPVAGVILSAPAVGAWETLPWYQGAALWTAAHTVPGLRVTGESLHRVPSDNAEMLRALYRDPLILKETRIGTVYGLAGLMSEAYERADKLDKFTTLVLYGERDEIIPKQLAYRMLKKLPRKGRCHVAFYKQGYHLLLRDLEAHRLWQDIVAWIGNPTGGLPSGADRRASAVLDGDASRGSVAVESAAPREARVILPMPSVFTPTGQ